MSIANIVAALNNELDALKAERDAVNARMAPLESALRALGQSAKKPRAGGAAWSAETRAKVAAKASERMKARWNTVNTLAARAVHE